MSRSNNFGNAKEEDKKEANLPESRLSVIKECNLDNIIQALLYQKNRKISDSCDTPALAQTRMSTLHETRSLFGDESSWHPADSLYSSSSGTGCVDNSFEDNLSYNDSSLSSYKYQGSKYNYGSNIMDFERYGSNCNDMLNVQNYQRRDYQHTGERCKSYCGHSLDLHTYQVTRGECYGDSVKLEMVESSSIQTEAVKDGSVLNHGQFCNSLERPKAEEIQTKGTFVVNGHDKGNLMGSQTCTKSNVKDEKSWIIIDSDSEDENLQVSEISSSDRNKSSPSELQQTGKHEQEDISFIRKGIKHKGIYQCETCGKVFGREVAMKKHWELLHKEEYERQIYEQYCGYSGNKCNVCGKTFSSVSSVKKHLQTHTGEKPFCCQKCNCRFSCVKSWQRHMKLHDSGDIKTTMYESLDSESSIEESQTSQSLQFGKCNDSQRKQVRTPDSRTSESESMKSLESQGEKSNVHKSSHDMNRPARNCQGQIKLHENEKNRASIPKSHAKQSQTAGELGTLQNVEIKKHRVCHETVDAQENAFQVASKENKGVDSSKEGSSDVDSDKSFNKFVLGKAIEMVQAQTTRRVGVKELKGLYDMDIIESRSKRSASPASSVCSSVSSESTQEMMSHGSSDTITLSKDSRSTEANGDIEKVKVRNHSVSELANLHSSMKKKVKVECHICGKCISSGNLNKHVKTHSGFKCLRCKRRFQLETEWANHMQTKHGEDCDYQSDEEDLEQPTFITSLNKKKYMTDCDLSLSAVDSSAGCNSESGIPSVKMSSEERVNSKENISNTSQNRKAKARQEPTYISTSDSPDLARSLAVSDKCISQKTSNPTVHPTSKKFAAQKIPIPYENNSDSSSHKSAKYPQIRDPEQLLLDNGTVIKLSDISPAHGQCPICGKSINNVRRHMFSHSSTLPYKCEVCGSSYSHKDSLLRHFETHNFGKKKETHHSSQTVTDSSVGQTGFSSEQGNPTHNSSKQERSTPRLDSAKQKLEVSASKSLHKRDKEKCSGSPKTSGSKEPGWGKPRCGTCKKAFTTYDDLKKHTLLMNHSAAENRVCKYCGRRYYDIYRLNQHMLFHTNKKSLKCDKCKRQFLGKGALKRHMKDHGLKLKYKCNICQDTFSQTSHLQRHVRTVHAPNRMSPKCQICKKHFRYHHELRAHKVVHENNEIDTDTATSAQGSDCMYSAKQKKKVVNSDKGREFQKSHEGKVESLSSGQVNFSKGKRSEYPVQGSNEKKRSIKSKKLSKAKHTRRKISELRDAKEDIVEREYQCDHCLETFTDPVELWKHMFDVHHDKSSQNEEQVVKHDTERKDVDSESISSRKSNHSTSFSEEQVKRFNCDSCSRSYMSKAALRKHIKISHAGGSNKKTSSLSKKPFRCSHCKRSFYYYSSLQRHRLSHQHRSVKI